MLNLRKIRNISKSGVPKEFTMEVIHKLWPIDRRTIIGTLADL